MILTFNHAAASVASRASTHHMMTTSVDTDSVTADPRTHASIELHAAQHATEQSVSRKQQCTIRHRQDQLDVDMRIPLDFDMEIVSVADKSFGGYGGMSPFSNRHPLLQCCAVSAPGFTDAGDLAVAATAEYRAANNFYISSTWRHRIHQHRMVRLLDVYIATIPLFQ